jgi:hypothetical protein
MLDYVYVCSLCQDLIELELRIQDAHVYRLDDDSFFIFFLEYAG